MKELSKYKVKVKLCYLNFQKQILKTTYFQVIKDYLFCDQVLQNVAVLERKFKKIFFQTSQPGFTSSELTLETLEQGVKYIQS